MQPPTDNPPNYVPFVAPALLQHLTLTDGAKLTAATLLMHRNRETGYCYATEETLALERNVTDRTIRNNLTELKSHSLVGWKPRKAPRGKAKGRGNLYDLGGLLDLCRQPIQTAAEIANRKPVSAKAPKTRKPVSGRERKLVSAHASDFRAIEQKQLSSTIDATASDPPSLSDGGCVATVTACGNGKQTTIEGGDRKPVSAHSTRIAKRGPLSPREIRQQLRAPSGQSASDICADADAWDLANAVVAIGGGEPFNPGDLAKLIDVHGSEAVWFHSQWFLPRLASLKTRPEKPTAFFVSCVRDDYDVDPSWSFDDRELPTDLWLMLNGINGSIGTYDDLAEAY